jgi:hypothetical protein
MSKESGLREICTLLAHLLVMPMTSAMKLLTVSKAKAQFSGIARKVVRSKRPVIVRVPNGFIQIAPYDLPEDVPAAPQGSQKLLPRELELHNTFGETL